MFCLINVRFWFKWISTQNLIGTIVLFYATLLSACPMDSKCSCKHSTIHCTGLSEIPDGIASGTESVIFEHGDINVIERDKLQHLNLVKGLQISHNNVSVIQKGAFDNLTSLRELSLRSNNIANLPQGIFSNLQNLKKLTLSDNKLQSLDGVLDGLVFLEILSADNNKISDISPQTFHHMKNLHHLKLEQNNLSSISEDTFINNKDMMLLSLGSNPIRQTDKMIPGDTKLHYLNLTDCQLSEFPRDLPPTLQLLTMSKNNITTIKLQDTIPYKHFTALVLDENNLSTVEKGAFSHMEQLRDLFLFINKLETIPGPFPKSLKNIHLDNNKIKAISKDTFQAGAEISLLSLRTNEISTVDKDAFKMITSIGKLDLETNPLAVLHDEMFMYATGLYTLSLSMLQLDTIQTDCFFGLDSLHTLKMSHVKIAPENIKGNFFKHTTQLQALEIENSPSLANAILSNAEMLESLSSLTEINLKQNQLKSLSTQFPTFFPLLTKINLARNLFDCVPEILWLKSWQEMSPRKFVEFNQVRCNMPHMLQGQRLTDLDYSQFFLNDTWVSYSPPTDTDKATPDYVDHPDYVDPPPDYDYFNYTDYDQYYNYETDHSKKSTSRQPESTTLISTPTKSMTKPSTFAKTNSTLTTSQDVESDPLKSVGIAVGMALAVIVTMLLLSAVLYICLSYRRNRRAVSAYQGKEDYVFIVSKTDIPPETNRPRMTREERGSTTSRASEDITNKNDLSMKVYTLDVDA